ncbi:hypothetical protein DV738_g4928, partial [Chaetothyriales sp. CBS 135597]
MREATEGRHTGSRTPQPRLRECSAKPTGRLLVTSNGIGDFAPIQNTIMRSSEEQQQFYIPVEMSASSGQTKGPYAPPTAPVGGLPTVGLDVPICAAFIALYLGAAAGHMTLFQLNRRRNQLFLLSALMFGFCMARVVTMVMRIVWACYLINVKVAMAATIFVNAGVLILFIVNVIFAHRILRAAHPYVGWHKTVTAIFAVFYILIIFSLAIAITAVVQGAYTLDVSIRLIDRKLQIAASSYMLFFSFLPILIVALGILVPSRHRLDKFGSGSWRAKIVILLTGTTILLLGSAFRAATVFLKPRLRTDPAWYHAKWAFYFFNFALEIIVIYLYLAARVDQRFDVPHGAKRPGDYYFLRKHHDNEKPQPGLRPESDAATSFSQEKTSCDVERPPRAVIADEKHDYYISIPTLNTSFDYTPLFAPPTLELISCIGYHSISVSRYLVRLWYSMAPPSRRTTAKLGTPTPARSARGNSAVPFEGSSTRRSTRASSQRPRAANYAAEEDLDGLNDGPLVTSPGPASRLASQSGPSGVRSSGVLQDVALAQSYGYGARGTLRDADHIAPGSRLVSKESAINEIDADVEDALGRFQDAARPAQQDLDAPSSRTRRKTSRGLSREPSVDPEKEKSSRVAAWADSVESDTEPSSFPSGIFDASYNFERGLRKPRYQAASPRPSQGPGVFERIQGVSRSVAEGASDRIAGIVTTSVDLGKRGLDITSRAIVDFLQSTIFVTALKLFLTICIFAGSTMLFCFISSRLACDVHSGSSMLTQLCGPCSDGVASPLLPKVNFFAPSNGAIVDPRRSSPTKAKAMSLIKRATLRALGITQTVAKGPLTALEPWQDVGDCWCAASRDQGDYIRLHVTTQHYIYPTELVLEHFPLSGSLNPGTTPKHLELWASVAALSDDERTRLKRIAADDPSPCTPTSPAPT